MVSQVYVAGKLRPSANALLVSFIDDAGTAGAAEGLSVGSFVGPQPAEREHGCNQARPGGHRHRKGPLRKNPTVQPKRAGL